MDKEDILKKRKQNRELKLKELSIELQSLFPPKMFIPGWGPIKCEANVKYDLNNRKPLSVEISVDPGHLIETEIRTLAEVMNARG